MSASPKLKRWSPAEKQLVIDSNDSCESLAQQLGRSVQAIQNVRTKATAKGIMTRNTLRNEIHRLLIVHVNQITDEIDALLGLQSSDSYPRNKQTSNQGEECQIQ